jgi:hypothetical protein
MTALSRAMMRDIKAAWMNLECRAELRKRLYGRGFAGNGPADEVTMGVVVVAVMVALMMEEDRENCDTSSGQQSR